MVIVVCEFVKVESIEQLLDEAMSNIKIYSVQTRNIRRGR